MTKRKPRTKKQSSASRKNCNSSLRNNSAVSIHQQTQYSGPIPPASELSNYDSVIPGAAERILIMAEKNQQHAIDIELKALDAARREARRGQVFAFSITILAFATAITAVTMHEPMVASVIGGTTVVSIAIAFIKGRNIK